MVRFKYKQNDSFLIPAVPESFPELKNWFSCILDGLHVSERVSHAVMISVDEIFTNIVTHGYTSSAEEKELEVSVSFDDSEAMLHITFTDHGAAYTPVKRNVEEIRERVKKHIIGGLGLYLVFQMMDNLKYVRENDCNVLTISKKVY